MAADDAKPTSSKPNFDFSESGYGARDFSITPGSRDFETSESRDLKGQKTPQRIRAGVLRDVARGRV
jgi:hypothetical protein